MLRLVLLEREPIPAVLARLPGSWTTLPGGTTRDGTTGTNAAAASGAWLDFYGIVRDREADASSPGAGPMGSEQVEPAGGFPIAAIDYEAHVEMAVHQLEKILDEAGSRYPLNAILVIHRIGRVPAGEASLLVRILSPHRAEALHACAEIIDGIKTWVPIWKHPERA
jgi:molybdopterin synthase catalytic subunit